jgi:hypothetical protein
VLLQVTRSADLAIEIPGNLSQGGSWYRLDYTPRVGYPPPNTTIAASDIGDVIKFRDGLPGTRYEYWLYYSNDTLHDWLTWTASITTRKCNFLFFILFSFFLVILPAAAALVLLIAFHLRKP